MTVLADWSPTNIWLRNGPNLPPVVSQTIPLADWPILGYGKYTAGGSNSGIFFASTAIRLPLFGWAGVGPGRPDWSNHLRPAGLPRNAPGLRCFRAQAPFQGPWFSV